MKKRHVNLGRTDENIADQYPNIFEGIQKDAAQNAWDARATKRGKDWKLVFRYIRDRNILVIEDFGTLGMNKERWENYQSLWDTTKAEESSLGARGQGKFLFHYFSTDKLVLTETIDENGQYRFSYGTTEAWDEDKVLTDFIPGASQLDHQGTRIWIMNVKKELLEDLLNYNEFIKYIASTWWEIIRDFNVIFIVNFNGVERRVCLPDFPKVVKEKPSDHEKIKDFGKIKNLRLFYCNEAAPEHFRGIAVQRGGMTIIRLPVNAEDSIKTKMYGYCNFDEELEAELKKVEQPNHFGFTNKRAWNHTKEYIIRKIDAFVQEITPRKQKVEIEEKLLNEAAKIVNDLFAQYAPELADSPKGIIPPSPPKPPRPPRLKLPLRIDIFRGNSKKFEYNETLKMECEIVNETDIKKDLYFYLEIRHKAENIKHKAKYSVEINPSGRYSLNIPLIDFDEKVDKKGEYKAEGVLKDANSSEELHKRYFTFYLGEEPPPAGKAFMAKFEIIVTAKNLFFERWRNLPISDKGVIRVIWDHPDFIHVREKISGKKAQKLEIFLYLIKIGIDEGIKELVVFKNNENILDLEEIKRLHSIRDEMYFDAVKKVEG